MNTPRQAFGALVRDHGPDLPLDIGVALIAADEQPGVDVAEQLVKLDELAERVTLREDAPLFESVARLHMCLSAFLRCLSRHFL